MRKKSLSYILLLVSLSLYLASCTPTVRVSQSQQTWNEYKGRNVKSVKRKETWRDR